MTDLLITLEKCIIVGHFLLYITSRLPLSSEHFTDKKRFMVCWVSRVPGLEASGLKAAEVPSSPSFCERKTLDPRCREGRHSTTVPEEWQMAGQISDIFGNGGSIILMLGMMEKVTLHEKNVKQPGFPSARSQARIEGSQPHI